MLWEVEIRALGRDGERERVCDEFDLLTGTSRGCDLIKSSSRGFLLEGEKLDQSLTERLSTELLLDPLVESAHIAPLGRTPDGAALTVLLKPGVMDPVSESVLRAASDIGIPVQEVRTFRRYYTAESVSSPDLDTLKRKILANDAIEQVVAGSLHADHLALGKPYQFARKVVPLRDLSADALVALSKAGMLALTLEEMQTIQAHFRVIGRDPTDVELETIAQTWSEHCSHKTLKGTVQYTESLPDGTKTTRRYANLLKETVFAATQSIRQQLGSNDWCVSVFADNAGVVRFTDSHHVCFKVETHNRPSAIEPYGGANTGLGGVIRDVLGTGLGAKPICNTDVFAFAQADYPADNLPSGVLHPRRVIQGVVSGSATTAIAWGSRRSTAPSSSMNVTLRTHSSSVAPSACSPQAWKPSRSMRGI